jgi:hypothetical protein
LNKSWEPESRAVSLRYIPRPLKNTRLALSLKMTLPPGIVLEP